MSVRCYWYILLDHPIKILDLEEYINSAHSTVEFAECSQSSFEDAFRNECRENLINVL